MAAPGPRHLGSCLSFSETPIKVQLFGAPGAVAGIFPSVIPTLTSSLLSFRAPCLLCIEEEDRQNQQC